MIERERSKECCKKAFRVKEYVCKRVILEIISHPPIEGVGRCVRSVHCSLPPHFRSIHHRLVSCCMIALLSLSHPLTLIHTLTHTLTHTYTHTLTHTLTHTHALFLHLHHINFFVGSQGVCLTDGARRRSKSRDRRERANANGQACDECD